MNEIEMENMLSELLNDDAEEEVRRVRTFEEEGLLTENRGLVLRMVDGSEFQITIVKSR